MMDATLLVEAPVLAQHHDPASLFPKHSCRVEHPGGFCIVLCWERKTGQGLLSVCCCALAGPLQHDSRPDYGKVCDHTDKACRAERSVQIRSQASTVPPSTDHPRVACFRCCTRDMGKDMVSESPSVLIRYPQALACNAGNIEPEAVGGPAGCTSNRAGGAIVTATSNNGAPEQATTPLMLTPPLTDL